MQAGKSAVKAFTVNRVGDMLFSVGLFAALWVFGSLDYDVIYSVAPQVNETALTVIGLLFFGGAMSKSAQVPLHIWLPDAMEGRLIPNKMLTVIIMLIIACIIGLQVSILSLPRQNLVNRALAVL